MFKRIGALIAASLLIGTTEGYADTVQEGDRYISLSNDFVYLAVVERYSGGRNARVSLYGHDVVFFQCTGKADFVNEVWMDTDQLHSCSSAKRLAKQHRLNSTLKAILDCTCRNM